MKLAMAIGSGQSGFIFNQQGITQNVPPSSGVYALYNDLLWVYIGESNDIQRRLRDHLQNPEMCVRATAPTAFLFELSPEAQRVARQQVLIARLGPVCNQGIGSDQFRR